MKDPQTLNQLVFFLVHSGVIAGLGIPLFFRLVPPNRLYGFRFKATFKDPDVWYAVNREGALWLFLTGLLLAGVSAWTYFARFPSYPSACLSGSAIFLGIVFMGIHGNVSLRRMTGTGPSPTAWLILLLLFVAFVGLLVSGLTLGLPR
ncbi:MAG: SdpI family protein [Planctomycetota bacterium]